MKTFKVANIEVLILDDKENECFRVEIMLPTGEIFKVHDPESSFETYSSACTGALIWLNKYADDYIKNNIQGEDQ